MDLISQIEMQDAIKVHTKLVDRLAEVVRVMAKHDEFFDSEKLKSWSIKRFHISETSRNETEPLSSVTIMIGTPASSRMLQQLGFRDWEEFEESDTGDLSKTFSFPTRYIYTENWESEVEVQSKTLKLWWAERKVKDLSRARGEAEERWQQYSADLVEAEAKLEALKSG